MSNYSTIDQISDMTNEHGREYLKDFKPDGLTIYYSDGNFFLVRKPNGYFFYFPYRNENGCKAGLFGDEEYTRKIYKEFEVFSARLQYNRFNELQGTVLCKNLEQCKNVIEERIKINPFYAVISEGGKILLNEHMTFCVR